MIKLAQTLLRRHSWTVALLQAMLISFSLVLAWLLRFDFTLPYRVLLFSSLPLLVLIRLAAIARFQLLHGWWNYTGLSDALDVFKAVTVGSVAFILFMHFVLDGTEFPRSVRSEEHTSELQSRGQLVCRLLLEKKKGTPPAAPGRWRASSSRSRASTAPTTSAHPPSRRRTRSRRRPSASCSSTRPADARPTA